MTGCEAVVNRVMAEHKIGMAAAARLLAAEGERPPHISSLGRCALKGARAADGTRVRLDVIRVGSKLLTSREAVARFVAALTAAPGDAPAPRSPAGRNRAAAKAGEELDALLGPGKGVALA